MLLRASTAVAARCASIGRRPRRPMRAPSCRARPHRRPDAAAQSRALASRRSRCARSRASAASSTALAARPELRGAAPRPLGGVGGEEELHRGVREHHGPDVAALHDDAALPRRAAAAARRGARARPAGSTTREAQLACVRPRGSPRDSHARRRAIRARAAGSQLEPPAGRAAGGQRRRRRRARRPRSCAEHADGAVHRARVDVGEAEPRGERRGWRCTCPRPPGPSIVTTRTLMRRRPRRAPQPGERREETRERHVGALRVVDRRPPSALASPATAKAIAMR